MLPRALGATIGWRRSTAAVAVLVALLGTVPFASAAAAQSASKKEQLLERFAPVMAIRHQKEQCDGDERFRPMTVDHVLGRDDVVVRDADDDVVVRAPTAEDLAGLDEDHWIDFPYDALKPGCDYEKWFRTFDATPSIYGRVTTDEGQLILQYWFYWVFNQWNDLHESDWEMIQLHFDTTDVDEALRSEPSLYAYAQHEGAEVAEAGDDRVELVDGTHPIVYASGGSHASYFSSTRWFGKSGATGFGCDDTTGPTEQITPEVVMLPREAPSSGELAWLSYDGRWGQRERFFNDGPTGPAGKDRWDEPVAWVEENGRDASVALPFARSGATKSFCNLSALGSSIFNRIMAEPIQVAVLFVAGVVALVVMVRFGSRGLLGRAMRSWWRRRRAFLEIAAVTLVGGVLALGVQYAVIELTTVGALVDVVGASSPWVLPLVALTGAVVLVPVTAWILAATMLLEAGETDARSALVTAWRSRSSVLWAGGVVVACFALTLFVIPLFVILISLWLLAPAVSAREQMRARASLRRSRRLLRGRRWRSLALSATLALVLAISGFVGALVLLATSVSFAVAAIVVVAANAFLIPYVTLVGVHYYEDVAQASTVQSRSR